MSDDPEALAAWLSDVSNDPVKFVETAFEWGTGELANSQRARALATLGPRANS